MLLKNERDAHVTSQEDALLGYKMASKALDKAEAYQRELQELKSAVRQSF